METILYAQFRDGAWASVLVYTKDEWFDGPLAPNYPYWAKVSAPTEEVANDAMDTLRRSVGQDINWEAISPLVEHH